MEFTCACCGGRVIGGQCDFCGEVYVTCCPRCGNRLAFEELEVAGEVLLRCAACDNTTDLQIVSWHNVQ